MKRWQLSVKEITKYNVIKDTINRYLKTYQAAEQLSLSIRQIFRLKKALEVSFLKKALIKKEKTA